MTREAGPTPPPGELDPAAPLVIAEKQRILRLIRALDRAGVAPDEIPALRAPLVRLAEVDEVLTAMLELFDRVRGAADEPPFSLAPFLQVCEAVRGEVLDALSARDQDAVRRATSQVAATEAEIWLEVEGFRRRPPRGAKRRAGPMPDAQATAAAERALASPRLRRPAGADRVAAQERSELPRGDAPLEAWLSWLPAPWLAAVARLHDLAAGPSRAGIVPDLAARLAAPDWLARFLTERLGHSEREILMTIVSFPEIPLADIRELRQSLAVHWDWEGGIPATSGGRLRAAGFVFVGTRAGALVATVPSRLRELLTAALARVDPVLAEMPDRARRLTKARALERAPHADPDLERWRKHDRAITRRFETWALADRGSGAAFAAYFGDGPREIHSEAESVALFEFALLDWRPAPDAPTTVERSLAEQPFRERDRQALAQSIAAARPALCRIASVRRGESLTFLPIFPASAPVVVIDRTASLLVEVGWIFAVRLYRAGPFTFFRWLSEPLPPEAERGALRELERARAAHAKSAGACDPAGFLAARPEALVHAMRKAAR